MKQERLIDRFMELVRIDSVSREERAMADFIKEELLALGGKVTEDNAGQKIKGTAGNIIAEFYQDKSTPVLLLSAHLDRVEPGKGIEPQIIGDYITSQGDTVLAGDDLIAVAVILEALTTLKESRKDWGRVKVVFSVAEEIGLLGAKALDPTHFKDANYGLVLDVDGEIGTIVYQAPFQCKFNATISGKAAHAGMHPDEGINAIKIASKAISDMELGQIDQQTTANIGVIKGGRAANIVPDFVELEGEARSLSFSSLEKQIEGMKNTVIKAVEKYQGQVEFDIKKIYDGYQLSKDSDIIKLIKRSIEEIGLPVNYVTSGGGSDANIYNKQGLLTVNIGIGMEMVHSVEERVRIDNMNKLLKLIITIIKNNKDFNLNV